MRDCDIDIKDFYDYCLSRGNVAYNYESPTECAFAQYLKDEGGFFKPLVGPRDYHEYRSKTYYEIPEWMNGFVSTWPWNFEAVVERIKQSGMLDKSVVTV